MDIVSVHKPLWQDQPVVFPQPESHQRQRCHSGRGGSEIVLMQHSPQAARQRNFVDCVSLQQRRQGWHCSAELVRLQVQELERAELHELSRDSARQLVEAKVETSQRHCRKKLRVKHVAPASLQRQACHYSVFVLHAPRFPKLTGIVPLIAWMFNLRSQYGRLGIIEPLLSR